MEKRESGQTEEVGNSGVFVGTYIHSLDPKKRLTIPADWREMVGVPRRLLVLPGVNDKCLCVYPFREMPHRMDKLRKLSIADTKGRQLARTLASRSDQPAWDSQGRIRIKDDLLVHAGIENQVVLAGTFDGFELWNPDEWNKINGTVDPKQLGDAARYVGF
ncbi:MAG: hypothetical protein KJ626_03945 [Verrucomicrobia bacterium]|nr:hypothetical protein [Verrucomicrobiota bacterium]